MELRAFRFRVPLRRLHLAGHDYEERTGLLLCDAATQSRWCEASPWPGFSCETLDDVIAAWRQGPPYPVPSLRFAVDAIEETPRTEVLRVPVNGLLLGARSAILHSTAEMSAAGFRAVKLKLGPNVGSPHECAQLVREVRQSLVPSVKLRLDANRAWSLAEAERFGQQIGDLSIEYCEEPTHSPDDLERFWEATQVPYALDESLREVSDLSPFVHAAALIVKPTLVGGRADIVRCQQWDIPLVFSGTFESGIGTRRVAQLSHEFSPGIPAGLDAYRWLLDDVIKERHSLSAGQLQMHRELTVCWDKLQEVPP